MNNPKRSGPRLPAVADGGIFRSSRDYEWRKRKFFSFPSDFGLENIKNAVKYFVLV
jgi:hypothetical protein